MNKLIKLIILSIFVFFTSCIPNKDLVYLQSNNSKEDATKIEAIAQKPYRLQVNDIISIRLKALDQKLVEMFNPSATEGVQGTSLEQMYFDGFTVDDHGQVRVPVLGQVSVIGLTLDEVRLKIEKQLLEEYFNKEADIFVNVKLAGIRYTVNGEIGTPGSRLLYNDKATILDAIANSGDITMVGNRKEVMVVRQYPHGTEMHIIDLTKADVMKSPYFYLQPNDFIYIKPLKQKSWGTGVNGLQTFTTIFGAASLLISTFLLIKR